MTEPSIPGIGPNERRMAEQLSRDEIALLIIAVEQFGDLIGDSHGVTGLHRNGDVAPWDELKGTWLDTFEEAAAPIATLRAARAAELERSKNARWSASPTGEAA